MFSLSALVTTLFHAASRGGAVPNLGEPSEAKRTPRYVNQVREWIRACDKLHGNLCVSKSIPQRPLEDVPLWLIDTSQQCIVPGISADRYLALSYVWPETRGSSDSASPTPHTLLLDSTNKDDFQSLGFLSSGRIAQRIPMVIRHAMELSHALGERYLWVDRLCIVQNDLGDGGTLSQVAKMDKIYGGAYLTIIAAAPEEIYEKGLALEGPSLEGLSYRRENRYENWKRFVEDGKRSAKKSSKLPEMSRDAITRAMSNWYAMLSSSRWATRGWTYQEQILCKRAIVFTGDGFFWDCHCCVWDGVFLLPGQNFAGIALRADMGQPFSTRWWPDFGFYLDLICPYNGREFSYPQDSVLGISGILNALGKSFPGGFIHGLPRLFLDHALLWQPFGTADRRVDRNEDAIIHSSLPSWSWCGWQSFVDPWSLRSGLSYISEGESRYRAGTWRTRNLVEWYLSTGAKPAEPVLEPRKLDRCVDLPPVMDVVEAAGWTRHDISDLAFNTKFLDSGPFFTHVKDESTYFKHPIPLKEDLMEQNFLSTPAYLTCSTTTVSLFPATVLKQTRNYPLYARAASKISVFEDKTFKRGPSKGRHCPILVLQQPNGAFAGLLRLMSNNHIDEVTVFELIAISTGSASARDLRRSLEWKIYETGNDLYHDGNYNEVFYYEPEWISKNGKSALLFGVAMAFDKDAARNEPLGLEFDAALAEVEECYDTSLTDSIHTSISSHLGVATPESFQFRDWFRARNTFLRKQAEDAHLENPHHTYGRQEYPARLSNEEGDACEFYNVLWIERSGGIAYRRACGWVPKHIWEAHATGPVEVMLG